MWRGVDFSREAYSHVRVVDNLTSNKVRHNPDVVRIKHETRKRRWSTMT